MGAQRVVSLLLDSLIIALICGHCMGHSPPVVSVVQDGSHLPPQLSVALEWTFCCSEVRTVLTLEVE